MWKRIFVLISLVTVVQAKSSEYNLKLPSLCKANIVSHISRLTNKQNWRRQDYSGVGTPSVYRTSTEKVGTWLEARIFNKKTVKIIQLLPDKTIQYSWEPRKCKILIVESLRRYDPKRLENEFSDQNLIKMIESNTSGVIYAWSPHMPLSMAGILPLKEATKKLGIELVLVLDPHADKHISIEMSKKYSLSLSALKKLESVDLMLRGLGFHYPSLVVYANRKIYDFAIPGVKTSEEYHKLISRQLSSLGGAR